MKYSLTDNDAKILQQDHALLSQALHDGKLLRPLSIEPSQYDCSSGLLAGAVIPGSYDDETKLYDWKFAIWNDEWEADSGTLDSSTIGKAIKFGKTGSETPPALLLRVHDENGNPMLALMTPPWDLKLSYDTGSCSEGSWIPNETTIEESAKQLYFKAGDGVGGVHTSISMSGDKATIEQSCWTLSCSIEDPDSEEHDKVIKIEFGDGFAGSFSRDEGECGWTLSLTATAGSGGGSFSWPGSDEQIIYNKAGTGSADAHLIWNYTDYSLNVINEGGTAQVAILGSDTTLKLGTVSGSGSHIGALNSQGFLGIHAGGSMAISSGNGSADTIEMGGGDGIAITSNYDVDIHGEQNVTLTAGSVSRQTILSLDSNGNANLASGLYNNINVNDDEILLNHTAKISFIVDSGDTGGRFEQTMLPDRWNVNGIPYGSSGLAPNDIYCLLTPSGSGSGAGNRLGLFIVPEP